MEIPTKVIGWMTIATEKECLLGPMAQDMKGILLPVEWEAKETVFIMTRLEKNPKQLGFRLHLFLLSRRHHRPHKLESVVSADYNMKIM